MRTSLSSQGQDPLGTLIRQGSTYYENLHNSVGKFDFVIANPLFNINRVDKENLTQVGRCLARLGVEHIPSCSPQGQGRSERTNRTLQDRLVSELRVARISTIKGANRYLRQRFLPQCNQDDYSKESPHVMIPASAFYMVA